MTPVFTRNSSLSAQSAPSCRSPRGKQEAVGGRNQCHARRPRQDKDNTHTRTTIACLASLIEQQPHILGTIEPIEQLSFIHRRKCECDYNLERMWPRHRPLQILSFVTLGVAYQSFRIPSAQYVEKPSKAHCNTVDNSKPEFVIHGGFVVATESSARRARSPLSPNPLDEPL